MSALAEFDRSRPAPDLVSTRVQAIYEHASQNPTDIQAGKVVDDFNDKLGTLFVSNPEIATTMVEQLASSGLPYAQDVAGGHAISMFYPDNPQLHGMSEALGQRLIKVGEVSLLNCTDNKREPVRTLLSVQASLSNGNEYVDPVGYTRKAALVRFLLAHTAAQIHSPQHAYPKITL